MQKKVINVNVCKEIIPVEQITPIPIWLTDNLTEEQVIQRLKQKREAFEFLAKNMKRILNAQA